MSFNRATVLYASLIVLVFAMGIAVGKYLFEPAETVIPAHYQDELSLLTWKGRDGTICFLLVPRSEKSHVTHDFWSKWKGKCGVSELKNALALVPSDKSVRWSNRPPRFVLPSERFCDEIVSFAHKNGVDLGINPMLDVEMFTDWEPR